MTAPTPSDYWINECIKIAASAGNLDAAENARRDLAAAQSERERLVSANEHWHIRVTQEKQLREQAEQELAAAQEAIERLKGALKLANDSCRSAYQVAARKGIETDWESLQFSLQKSLNEQHKVMYPEQYTEDRRIHAHAHPKGNK